MEKFFLRFELSTRTACNNQILGFFFHFISAPFLPHIFIFLLKTMAANQTLAQKFTYDVALWLFNLMLDIFFREVRPRGAHKIPKEGPVIFVVAPHANQVSH